MAHVVSYFWMESIDKCSTRGPSLLRGKAVCKASEQIRSTKLKSVVTLHSKRCTLHLKRKQTLAPEITSFFPQFFFWSQSTYTLWQIHYNTFHNKMQKQPRVPHIICHAAVKNKKNKKKHVCTWPRRAQKRELWAGKASEGTQKEAGEWVSSQSWAKTELGQNSAACWAWHSKQECFQTVKRGEKKDGRGERRREGGRVKRRNESRGDMCLTRRNSSGSNLHIYDHSPEWAHCERGTTTTKKQEIRKIDEKKWFNGGRAKEGRWPSLIDILYCHAATHLSMRAASN